MEQIDAPKIVATVKKIQQRGAREIASRCLSNVSQVFRYAMAHRPATFARLHQFASDVINGGNMVRIDCMAKPNCRLKNPVARRTG